MNRFVKVLSATAVSGGILSFVANHAQAQIDYFNSTGEPPTAATCEAQYQDTIKQVRQDETSANIKYKEENRNCNAGRSGDTSCFSELRKRIGKDRLDFMVRQINAEATREICVERVKLAANPGAELCEQVYRERLNEENILAQAKLKKDNLVCNLEGVGNKCTNADKQRLSDWFSTGEKKAAEARTLCETRSDAKVPQSTPTGEHVILPPGAVPSGQNPDAPETGPGIIGSFPHTISPFDFCWTYCLNGEKTGKFPGMYEFRKNPNDSGRPLNEVKPGDVVVFFKPSYGGWRALHFALYKGKGIVYFKNGVSDVYIGKLPDYLKNYPGWIERVF